MDLRSIYSGGSNSSRAANESATIQFVANLQSNLGATLDHSWLSGRGHTDDDERIQYSDNPFAAGLLDATTGR